MKSIGYFEHTADIGVRARGKNLSGVFIYSGLSILEVALGENRKSSGKKAGRAVKRFSLSAGSAGELLVGYLNELIYLLFVKKLHFNKIEVSVRRPDKNRAVFSVKAVLYGKYDRGMNFQREIKAATYGGLSLRKYKRHWTARFILDV